VIAMKRRIEVTRECWRRIRIGREARVCPFCHGAAELASIPSPIDKCGVSEASFARNIRSGLVAMWQMDDGEPAVCLGCLNRRK
jgi:hypothetical protein